MAGPKQQTPPKKHKPDGDDLPSFESGSRQRPWDKIVLYAVISLICFLCAAGILALLLWKGDQLVTWGLTGNLYYLVLLPIGLLVAGFLFGMLRAHASYKGKQFGDGLGLRGPIVAFLLVVIGGFWLVPSEVIFPLTVYAQGEAGPSDVTLKKNFGDLFNDSGDHPDKVRLWT